MSHSTRSSGASATCRIDWRPSRWLLAIVLALTLLSAFAVLASEMPRAAAWPLALGVLACGGRLLYREARRVPCTFVFAGGAAPVLLDGERIAEATVRWRGVLAFVRWRDGRGRVRRLVWWPDTLSPQARRELRLAAPGPGAAPPGASVAP